MDDLKVAFHCAKRKQATYPIFIREMFLFELINEHGDGYNLQTVNFLINGFLQKFPLKDYIE